MKRLVATLVLIKLTVTLLLLAGCAAPVLKNGCTIMAASEDYRQALLCQRLSKPFWCRLLNIQYHGSIDGNEFDLSHTVAIRRVGGPGGEVVCYSCTYGTMSGMDQSTDWSCALCAALEIQKSERMVGKEVKGATVTGAEFLGPPEGF